MRHFDPGIREIFRRGEFTHDGDRSALDGLQGELTPVGLGAGEREKEIARFHAARIVIEPGNLKVRKWAIRRKLMPEAGAREDLCEVHRANITRICSPAWTGLPGAGICERATPLPSG